MNQKKTNIKTTREKNKKRVTKCYIPVNWQYQNANGNQQKIKCINNKRKERKK